MELRLAAEEGEAAPGAHEVAAPREPGRTLTYGIYRVSHTVLRIRYVECQTHLYTLCRLSNALIYITYI